MGGKSDPTIGYKYYLGMHLIICAGPVDAVQAFVVGERLAWSGNVTTSQQVFVDAPELFGGDHKEGGVQGPVDIMMGEPTQARNSYLQGLLGTVIPAFRGVVSLVLRQCYVAALSPYPKAWAVKVLRIPMKSWYPATANINAGSANGAHIIYETLTNADWGMGYPITIIDDASFRAAALTLFNENLGLSFIMVNQDSVENFIYNVLGHINGMIYTDPQTGKFSIKLLRSDYVAGTLPLFDESNIVSLDSYERPAFAEMVNEIVLTYRQRGAITDDSVTVQDLAAIQAQQGIVSQTVAYPGIDDPVNASRLAMRDLKQRATPLAKVTIKVNRAGWNLTVGGVFRFSWAEHGVSNLVLRILQINYGTIDDGTITLQCAEDVFGLGSATYMGNQPSLWTDPIKNPLPLPIRKVFEGSYWDVATRLPGSVAGFPDNAAFMGAIGGYDNYFISNYQNWAATVNADANYKQAGTGDLCPHARLTTLIGKMDLSFTLDSISSGTRFITVNTWGYIENEIVQIVAFDATTGNVTVKRGCLDTVPVLHAAGVRLFFCNNGVLASANINQYTAGVTVYTRLLTRTGKGLLGIASAPTDTTLTAGRFGSPYPPGNFKINAAYFPAKISGPMLVTYAHRDRLLQLNQVVEDFTAGDIGPEPGTTYRVRIYNTAGTTLIRTFSGITLNNWQYTDALAAQDNFLSDFKIVLDSQRSTFTSLQSHENVTARYGLGFRLGIGFGGAIV